MGDNGMQWVNAKWWYQRTVTYTHTHICNMVRQRQNSRTRCASSQEALDSKEPDISALTHCQYPTAPSGFQGGRARKSNQKGWWTLSLHASGPYAYFSWVVKHSARICCSELPNQSDTF